MADETEIKFRFTPKGQQISAAILGGKDKIEFTKAAASIDVHINDTDTDVANIIDLDNKKQIVDISGTVAVNNNVVQIPIKFEKNKIAEDYQMNTIGIYAKYQGQEFLYAFGALKYPLYMHHTDDSGVFKMYTYITVGTVANVVIKTDNTESVSHDELARELQKYRDELKSLDPLNSPDGNNIYNTTINLDTYSTVGITKFLECKLQSSGQMSGFDQATDKLYGWILNIPKWNGATEFQQIVYICNYGQGTLTYVRSRVNNSGTNKEDFEKVLTDKDLQKAINSFGQTKSVNNHKPDDHGNIDLSDTFAEKTDLGNLYGMTANGVKQTFSGATVNPDTITDTGVYKISACSVNAQVDGKSLSSAQWGWLIVLNYNENNTTNALYQFLISNEEVSRRVVSLQYQTFPSFKTIVDSDDLKPINDAIAKKIESINGHKANSNGDITLPSLDNPDYTITSAPFDLDTVSNNGIYRFNGANLTASKRASALASLPTTAINGAKGYLIQIQYTDYYTMQLLILYDVPNNTDITLAFRCVGLDSSGYRDTFKRILTDIDFSTLDNKITALINQVNSQVYNAPDYDTGLAYSKAHPNAWVTTP